MSVKTDSFARSDSSDALDTLVQKQTPPSKPFTLFGSRNAAIAVTAFLAVAALASAAALILNSGKELDLIKFKLPLPSDDILKGVAYGAGGVVAATGLYQATTAGHRAWKARPVASFQVVDS